MNACNPIIGECQQSRLKNEQINEIKVLDRGERDYDEEKSPVFLSTGDDNLDSRSLFKCLSLI